MRVAILTTDTKHHRYFANKLSARAETWVLMETRTLDYSRLYFKHLRRRKTPWALLDNPYLRLPAPTFDRLQGEFEDHFWDDGTPSAFQGHQELTTFPSANDPACISVLKEVRPELIISFGTGLIRREILGLDAFKVNIHRGILPRYRGLDADLWALYHRDFDRVGTTVHRLDAQFDTGPIVAQERLELGPSMRAHQIRYHTTLQATRMIEGLIDRMASDGGPGELVPQDLSQGRQYSHIPPLKRWLAIRRFHAHVLGLPTVEQHQPCQ